MVEFLIKSNNVVGVIPSTLMYAVCPFMCWLVNEPPTNELTVGFLNPDWILMGFLTKVRKGSKTFRHKSRSAFIWRMLPLLMIPCRMAV